MLFEIQNSSTPRCSPAFPSDVSVPPFSYKDGHFLSKFFSVSVLDCKGWLSYSGGGTVATLNMEVLVGVSWLDMEV